MMRTPYNWAEDVKKLKMPVMLVYGDSDMYRPEHIVEFYHLLGGGLRDAGWQQEHMSQNRLAILPGLTHYDIFLSPMLTATVLPFLNGENATKELERSGRGAFELMVARRKFGRRLPLRRDPLPRHRRALRALDLPLPVLPPRKRRAHRSPGRCSGRKTSVSSSAIRCASSLRPR